MEGVLKFIVRVTASEPAKVAAVVNRGQGGAEKRKRAPILLQAHASPEGPSWSDGPIAAAVDVGKTTIQRTRQAYVEHGVEAALERQRPPGRQ